MGQNICAPLRSDVCLICKRRLVLPRFLFFVFLVILFLFLFRSPNVVLCGQGVVQSQGFVHFYSAGGPRDLVANLMDR